MIMFQVLDLEKLPKPFDKKFFEQNTSIGHTPSFMNLTEVTCRFSVFPGIYCIVPSTFNPNLEAEFILRVFSVGKHNMKYFLYVTYCFFMYVLMVVKQFF